jgi:hypothetical protein
MEDFEVDRRFSWLELKWIFMTNNEYMQDGIDEEEDIAEDFLYAGIPFFEGNLF